MNKPSDPLFQPLADRLRPTDIAGFVGQKHLLGRSKPLWMALERGAIYSMVLWGPPGTGKTTLARLLAQKANARFEKLSAVLAGVKEIRAVITRAQEAQSRQQATILFVDEAHRFNKAQQDSFLPYVENGTITFIGATTENPSFEINNALLSRVRVYVLKSLTIEELVQVIDRALTDKELGYGKQEIAISSALKLQLAHAADGDARRVLNLLELAVDCAHLQDKRLLIDAEVLAEICKHGVRRFDNSGEDFYNQISALHKSIRGSAPDAALYWLARILDGGCDPLYVARRLVRVASEDVGNADPRALQLTLNAWNAYERLGSPEGELALAQVVTYLACAPKSNAVYTAMNAALADAEKFGSLEVPLYLRNAPTQLMRQMDYGKQYRYAHDEPDAYAAGVEYLPNELQGVQYYYPVERGLEIKIAAKLRLLRSKDRKAREK